MVDISRDMIGAHEPITDEKIIEYLWNSPTYGEKFQKIFGLPQKKKIYGISNKSTNPRTISIGLTALQQILPSHGCLRHGHRMSARYAGSCGNRVYPKFRMKNGMAAGNI